MLQISAPPTDKAEGAKATTPIAKEEEEGLLNEWVSVRTHTQRRPKLFAPRLVLSYVSYGFRVTFVGKFSYSKLINVRCG